MWNNTLEGLSPVYHAEAVAMVNKIMKDRNIVIEAHTNTGGGVAGTAK